MEADIVSSLSVLGCTISIPDVSDLDKITDPKNNDSLVGLSKVVHFLAEKLGSLCSIEERVNAIEKQTEVGMFCMELAGLLRELSCPYMTLMEGPIDSRLSSKENRLKLLNFLISECQAAIMIDTHTQMEKKSSYVETPIAEKLKTLLVTLGFSKPPQDITSVQLFSKVAIKVQEMLAKLPKGYPGPPLLKVGLTEAQWGKLSLLMGELMKDYKLRREMLLTRLDVTVLSFTWSANVKTKLDEMSSIFQPIRSELQAEPGVTIGSLLSAREEIGYTEKTSSASVREKTKTPLQRLLIGAVPDRGGRPTESRRPPPEMPSWQKRRPDTGGRGGHRGGGGGGGGGQRGGGRVQGGWNQGGSSWNQDQKSQWRGRGRR